MRARPNRRAPFQRAKAEVIDVLRVTVEIWPGGEPRRARILATAFIANVSDLEDISNYTMRVPKASIPSPAHQRGKPKARCAVTTGVHLCGVSSPRSRLGRPSSGKPLSDEVLRKTLSARIRATQCLVPEPWRKPLCPRRTGRMWTQNSLPSRSV